MKHLHVLTSTSNKIYTCIGLYFIPYLQLKYQAKFLKASIYIILLSETNFGSKLYFFVYFKFHLDGLTSELFWMNKKKINKKIFEQARYKGMA